MLLYNIKKEATIKFCYKNITLSFFFFVSKLGRYVGETGTMRRRETHGGLLYWLAILTKLCFHIQGPFSTSASRPGRWVHCPPTLDAHRTSWIPESLLTADCKIDRYYCGCLHTWFHNAYTFPDVNTHNPLPAINPRDLFTSTYCSLPVYTAGTWRLYPMSICNRDWNGFQALETGRVRV